MFLGFPFDVAFFAPPAYSPLSLSSGDYLWGSGLQPTFSGGPCCFCLGRILFLLQRCCIFFFLLLLGVTSALAEPPWCVCSACLGTPAVFTLGVMQLAALLGFPCWLTQVGCSTPAVMVSHGVGGCLVTVVLCPPYFLFCDCAASPSAASPSGFCPLTG